MDRLAGREHVGLLPMKLIALLPFKNEEWILPTYLSSVASVVDAIVAFDDGSTDGSRRLIEEAGGRVVANRDVVTSNWSDNDAGRRAALLRIGRELGGTHFISLDADEALTTPCRRNLREAVSRLRPGERVAMQWVTLWRSPFQYRRDGSVWSDLFKDFAFADRDDLEFMGVARTAGPNRDDEWVRLGAAQGAVMHYQFVPWERCQAKQAWYRCSELISAPDRSYAINRMFAMTLDDNSTQTENVPAAWIQGLAIPNGLSALPPAWHLQAIYDWFDEFGVEFFEPLQIWHVPQLHERFIDTVGREPRAMVHLGPARRVTGAVRARLESAKRNRA
jgi:hypothetical protein